MAFTNGWLVCQFSLEYYKRGCILEYMTSNILPSFPNLEFQSFDIARKLTNLLSPKLKITKNSYQYFEISVNSLKRVFTHFFYF